jgi:hypothetical protein
MDLGWMDATRPPQCWLLMDGCYQTTAMLAPNKLRPYFHTLKPMRTAVSCAASDLRQCHLSPLGDHQPRIQAAAHPLDTRRAHAFHCHISYGERSGRSWGCRRQLRQEPGTAKLH